MIEYFVSLYSSVYWTKRVAVVFGLLVFLCSGIRVFQFVSNKVTQTVTGETIFPPELGFGQLDELSISHIDTPSDFVPSTFTNNTLKGNFDVDNDSAVDYPLEKSKLPIVNVYKILDNDKTIDLSTTEIPRKIAKNFDFLKEPSQTLSTIQIWKEGSRELKIDGQYLLIEYDNNLVKELQPSTFTSNLLSNETSLKAQFETVLKSYGIESNFSTYKFKAEYVQYDSETKLFIPSSVQTSGEYLRISAERIYSSLSKIASGASTFAVYPDYNQSNNNVVISKNAANKDIIVELNLHNWPVNQDMTKVNPDVQTYSIKTAKAAFEELKSTNKFLVSVTDKATRKPVKPEELSGIDTVQVNRIKVEMYENTVNIDYIQPVYVFVSEATKGTKQLELVYYIPAVIQNFK